MRTTLNIDDDALAALRDYAKKYRLSLGDAASDLINRGIEAAPKFKKKNGWVILESPPGAPPLTTELVKEIEQEFYEEEYRRAFPHRR